MSHEDCEGKHREQTRTNLPSNLIIFVNFPTRVGPAFELRSKPSNSDRTPVPSSEAYLRCDDNHDDCVKSIVHRYFFSAKKNKASENKFDPHINQFTL